MMSLYRETIYALSSGGLPSGVAVIRLSGCHVRGVLEALCGQVPEARKATLRWIRDRNNQAIDQGLVVFFEAPHSFTGEDCGELHVHGGRAVVKATLDILSKFPGLRHAEPGEFSRRAFANGKLDLVEIEGLADLIRAETEMQRVMALQQADGGLSSRYRAWSSRLTRARALIEAELDFSDEADVPGSVSDSVWSDMAALSAEIGAHIATAKISEIIRDGYRVVIAGPPNSGKSSLINLLSNRDVAIVSDIAGTTRDVLSVDLDIGGYAVRISDTAGLRQTEDPIEREGVLRSERSIREADLVLMLRDVSDEGPEPEPVEGSKALRIITKIDLLSNGGVGTGELGISTVTGEGIDSLVKQISICLQQDVNAHSQAQSVRTRHVDLLRMARAEIERALAESGSGIEIRAEYLRRAGHFLGKITGSVDVEDLLDVVFSEFCVGK